MANKLICDYSYHCTAVLISDRHLLTSAHCVMSRNQVTNLKVIFSNAPDLFVREAVRFIKVPEYLTHNNVDSDIAIIELKSPVLSIKAPNIGFNLTCSEYKNIPRLMAAGYATNSYLRLAKLTLSESCNGRNYLSLIYSGYAEPGDSGGPLFYSSNDEFYILGIMSTTNGYKNGLNYFTPLLLNKKFIEEHVKLNKTYIPESDEYIIIGQSLNIYNWSEVEFIYPASATSVKKAIFVLIASIYLDLIY